MFPVSGDGVAGMGTPIQAQNTRGTLGRGGQVGGTKPPIRPGGGPAQDQGHGGGGAGLVPQPGRGRPPLEKRAGGKENTVPSFALLYRALADKIGGAAVSGAGDSPRGAQPGRGTRGAFLRRPNPEDAGGGVGDRGTGQKGFPSRREKI